MAPIRRVVKRARAAAEKASAVHTISAAERAQHAALPPLVRQGPRWLTVAACRPANPRTARLTAQHYLLAVKDMFDILPLEAKQGDITKPTETYGGLGASFSYNHGVAHPYRPTDSRQPRHHTAPTLVSYRVSLVHSDTQICHLTSGLRAILENPSVRVATSRGCGLRVAS